MSGPNTIEAPATVVTTPDAPKVIDPKPPEGGEPADIPTGTEGQPEGGEGAEGSVTDAIKNAADNAVQKFEFIVDGKPVTREYTPAQVKQMLQKAEGADRRFSDASRVERMNQELLWLAKNAPEKLLSHPAIGVDPHQWAENLLYEKIKLEQMDPKDRELMETQNKLKASESRKQQIERQVQQEKVQRAVEYEKANHSRDISESLGAAGLPVNNYTIKRTAHYMLEGMAMNLKVSAKDILPLVLEDYKSEQSALFNQSDPEALASLLGEENLKKIRNYEMKRIKADPNKKPVKRETSMRDIKPGPKKMSMEEFRDYNEKIKRGEIQ